MDTSGLSIDEASGEEELREFCLFADEVNAQRSAFWPTMLDMQLPLLRGEGPVAQGRRALPLVARSKGRIVARAAALVDQRYIEHWDEPLGHALCRPFLGSAEGYTGGNNVGALEDNIEAWHGFSSLGALLAKVGDSDAATWTARASTIANDIYQACWVAAQGAPDPIYGGVYENLWFWADVPGGTTPNVLNWNPDMQAQFWPIIHQFPLETTQMIANTYGAFTYFYLNEWINTTPSDGDPKVSAAITAAIQQDWTNLDAWFTSMQNNWLISLPTSNPGAVWPFNTGDAGGLIEAAWGEALALLTS